MTSQAGSSVHSLASNLGRLNQISQGSRNRTRSVRADSGGSQIWAKPLGITPIARTP